MSSASEAPVLWPLVVYFLSVVFLVVAMIGLSHILGERHHEKATGEVYESGILTTGSARLRLSAHFYLVAMFFVIFDLETVFIVAWALGVRELGWLGYAEILVFIGVLFVALIYLWRLGALDWGPRPRFIRREQGIMGARELGSREAREQYAIESEKL